MFVPAEQNVSKAVNWLIDNQICTDDEYILVSNINGHSIQTVNDILYARTGYHSIEQYMECEQIEA